MTLSQRIWALVNVRPEETHLVRLVLVLAAATGVVKLLGSTAAYALFLGTFDAQRLPLIYIGASILSTLIALIYLRVEKRYTLAQLLVGQTGLILLTLVGYRLGLTISSSRWLIFSLPIYDGVVSTLMFTAFWNLVGRLFNLQQGKRLFSLFGAGQEVAIVVTGLLLPLFVTVIGTANLLWGAAVANAVALAVLLLIIRRASAVQMPHSSEENEAMAEESPTTPNWLTDPYIILILVVCICFGLGDYFVDNIFYLRVEAQLTRPEQLAGFLGVFSSVVSGLSLCSHLFLSGYILRRYGVRTLILLTPFLLLVITALFVLSGILTTSTALLFWLAVVMMLTSRVTHAFDNTAFNLLYQPLPAPVRMRTQTTIDGIVYPAAGGVAGLILLFLTSYLQLNSLQLAYVLLPLVSIWLLATIALGRVYPHRVQQALRQRIVRGNSLFTPDRVSLDIIQQHLRSPHPGAVLYALDLLATHDRENLNDYLPALLEHPTVEVRLAAIAQIETTNATHLLELLAQCLTSDPDNDVRSAALRTLATLGGLSHNEALHEQLSAENIQVRQGVMVGLLRSGELEGILAAGTQLAQLVQSPVVAERILAAQVLGESGVASFYRPLLQLLQDPVPAVQRAALSAAGKVRQPKLWPLAVAALATTATRSAAQNALVAAGEESQAAIRAGWAAASHDPALRMALARTCGRLRNPGAISLLLDALDDPDVGARTHILAALYQCGYQAPAADRARFEAAIEAELSHAAWTLAGIVDLASADDFRLVHDALWASLLLQQSRLFHWLSLLYDPAIIRRVRDVVAPAIAPDFPLDAEQRAYALETLDLLLDTDFKAPLLTLFDDVPPISKLAKLGEFAPQSRLDPAQRLHAILCGPTAWLTPWLHATALYIAPTVAVSATASLAAALHQATNEAMATTNALVAESAQWAVRRFPSRPAEPIDPMGAKQTLVE